MIYVLVSTENLNALLWFTQNALVRAKESAGQPLMHSWLSFNHQDQH